HQDLEHYPVPTTPDPEKFWHYFSRPRTGRIWAFDIPSGRLTKLVETEGVTPDHMTARLKTPAWCATAWTCTMPTASASGRCARMVPANG
ncbi:MAG: hypothetical protein ABSE73_14100, partial [Planctomycetota bacterium]